MAMENSYAQALWQMIEGGMQPKKAIASLFEHLKARGRTALMPRLARAFARIAEREARRGLVLSVARREDARAAALAVQETLKDMKTASEDVRITIDENQIGGWRLEGDGTLIDASYKRYLLDLYGKVISKS